jgi:tetratricopeptide (TPR) repeat protein
MGRLKDAEATLRRALELAPDCSATRQNYCLTLIQQMRWKEANIQLKILMEEQPDNPRFSAMLATNLVMLGERDEGMRVLADAKSSAGQDAAFWQHYAHAARMAGEGEESIIDAFRKCVALDPAYGSAWWGLADLKTYRFSPAEITTLKEQLSREDLSPGHRCYMEFTYGSALENAGEFSQSFEHYAKANALRRPFIVYHADATHQDVQNLKKLFTTDFFEARRGVGCPAPDPIFIVGMPRAGSTLVEQVLSSHSLVEGTMELPDLGNIVGELVQKHAPQKPFPTFLADLDAETLRRLGEDYLQRTQPQRKLGKPYFTDKTGSNFLHSGLIQLILPNAKIVDARRHPLACGFSCYKQAFGPGALHLAYDQTDIGRYYRDYVDMMAHYDKVLPGRVHRVIHEKLTLDPEREIRRLLDYCGLPFEEQCLRSHETKRSVRTASSQQVRQPIQKKKVEAWEHYAPWLQPMRDALGDVLTSSPDVPAFD